MGHPTPSLFVKIDPLQATRVCLDIEETAPMRELPETGFLRLQQIIGNPKARPPIPPIIPVSKSTWWAGVAAGKYPPGVKISARCTAWPISAIRELIDGVK